MSNLKKEIFTLRNAAEITTHTLHLSEDLKKVETVLHLYCSKSVLQISHDQLFVRGFDEA